MKKHALFIRGVAHTTHVEGRRLVVDIGGGSTEFAIGEQFNILQLSSQPIGCVTYTKRYFSGGNISREAFEAAELAVSQRLEIIDRRFCNTGWQAALGLLWQRQSDCPVLGKPSWPLRWHHHCDNTQENP